MNGSKENYESEGKLCTGIYWCSGGGNGGHEIKATANYTPRAAYPQRIFCSTHGLWAELVRVKKWPINKEGSDIYAGLF